MKAFKPDAVMPLSNHGGISIMLTEHRTIIYKWYDNRPSRECKLYYLKSGHAYFKIRGKRYHLKNFLRTSLS